MNSEEIHLINGHSVGNNFDELSLKYDITPELNELLLEMQIKVSKKKNSAVKELQNLIKKYPRIPHFKNYLAVLFARQNNLFMSNEVNKKLVVAHPDYLYGKLYLAQLALEVDKPDEVPIILGETLQLKDLYPERKVFNYGELFAYQNVVFNYYIAIGNQFNAQACLDVIATISKTFNLNLDTLEYNRKIMLLTLESQLKQHDLMWSTNRTPEVIAKRIVEPTTEAPQFTHDIINELYRNDLNIDPQIITNILALPRQSLLADLHKVVYDSMARLYVFIDENADWDNKTHEFLMHALLLLVELHDESSLEVMLDILRQHNDYLEPWFSDYLTDGYWELLYHIADDKLDALRNFLFEPNHYTYSQSVITDVAKQIFLHQPNRQAEIINWYKIVFEEWIIQHDNDSIIDTEVIAFFVSDAVNLNMIDLIPQITNLFDLELVAVGISGDLESCIKDILNKENIDRKREVFVTIFERYNHFTSTWISYKDEEENEVEDEDDSAFNDEADDLSTNEIYQDVKNTVILPNVKPNVGRNEPCPCGSGKKYKKCCLK